MSFDAMEFDRKSGSFTKRVVVDPSLCLGEILVRVTSCTICGSDLHTFSGRRESPPNCVLGHEIIGTILEWNSDWPPQDYFGNDLKKGQRVTWSMAVGCGNCFFCRNQLSQKCESLFKYGHQRGGGVPTGGLSEVCRLVPGTPIFPIPDTLPDEVATPANCSTATVSAALRLILQTHQVSGASVLVLGAGMLGLTAAAQLADAGAHSIVVADPDPHRRDLAMRFGATLTVGVEQQAEIQAEIVEQTRSVSHGRGCDIAMDFAGTTSAVQTSLAAVRTGGCVILAGSVFPGPNIETSPEQVVRRMLTVRGLHNYLAEDLATGLAFLERTHERFPFAELVSQRFALNQADEAFRYAVEQRPIRVAVQNEN